MAFIDVDEANGIDVLPQIVCHKMLPTSYIDELTRIGPALQL